MEAPVSASLGVVRSLPPKLEQLLSPEAVAGGALRLSDGAKNKIRLLKDLLQELIDRYLMEPSDVVEAAATARCWMKEVRELSYDIDDFLHELIQGNHSDPKKLQGKIPWLREGQSRRRWIAHHVSLFTDRLRDAIRRHKNYNLDRCMMLASSIDSDERPLPPLLDLATAPLVGIDGSMEKLQEWLVGDGGRNHRSVSIVGFGGVGKTTLAKALYRKIESQFECRAFVRTSKKPDVRKLLSSILLQVRPERQPDASEYSNLIQTIRAHLQHKKYFIVMDDLWASSTWDTVCRALPDTNCFSRVLITTEIDVVAQKCCVHDSEYIFKMGPLGEDEARRLFFSRFPGDQSETGNQSKVLMEIIRKCGGFPLATVSISSLLARQNSLTEQCYYIRRSLSSSVRENHSMEGMKQVLRICYSDLPCHLKACMLYISIYKEDHIIWKDDLVKQWIAEGFICAKEGKNMEQVASAYFDELISRGLIQPEDVNYSGEVVSCTVHYMILNLIKYKSVEENFVTAIDCSQTNIRLADKVRRLSLLFGDADDAEPPANLRLSQVRSLVFHGQRKSSLPCIGEFRHLRVLVLHLWGDEDNISLDLTTLCRLFGLTYLEIECNVTLNLLTEMQGLKHLETLKIASRVSAVPEGIVHLPELLHLILPGDTNLPNVIGRLTTLQTLGCFDLTRNSEENVESLSELTNVRDLRLTCSESQCESDDAKKHLEHLSSVLSELGNLKSLTLLLASGSYNENTLEVSSRRLSTDISFDLSNVASPPILLEKLELMPRISILPKLPGWIRELRLLRILKIEVRSLSGGGDIDVLKGLPALTALSLYVRTTPAERVMFHKDGFPILKHLMFTRPALCVAFVEGAMPNLRRLELGFNVGNNTIGRYRYSIAVAGFENLTALQVLSARVGAGCSGADELSSSKAVLQSALEDTLRQSRSPPTVDIELVDWVFYSDKEREIRRESATRQQTAGEGSTSREDIITPLPLPRSPSPPPQPRPPRGCGGSMLLGPLFTFTGGCGGLWSSSTSVKPDQRQDGLLWWCGLAPCHGGQFSMALVQANHLLEDQCRLETRLVGAGGTLIGVFDGHGGPEAARFACDRLLTYIQKASSGQQGVTTEDDIKKAFHDTEEGFLEVVSRQWETQPTIAMVGTCCLVGVLERGSLLVANIGHSRAVLGKIDSTGKKISAKQLSNEHDASQEAVRNELIAQHPDDPLIVVFSRNAWRVKGITKISRSIGDAYLKYANYNSERIPRKFRLREPITKPILRADPDIICRELQPSDRFVIFASDGLWEHLSNQEAAEIVHSHQPAGSARRLIKAALQATARKHNMPYSDLKKIDRGARRHFHDDITVIVLFIDYNNKLMKDSAQAQDLSVRYPSTCTPQVLSTTQGNAMIYQLSALSCLNCIRMGM